MRRPPFPQQLQQLPLLDWKPPKPVARFEDEQVRAASITAKIAGIALIVPRGVV